MACFGHDVDKECQSGLGLTRELTDEVHKNEIGTSLPEEYVKVKLKDPKYSPL
jgi:hypothetical protein